MAEECPCIVLATAIELGTRSRGAPFGVGMRYQISSSSAKVYASQDVLLYFDSESLSLLLSVPLVSTPCGKAIKKNELTC
jgi:hypothetical protein